VINGKKVLGLVPARRGSKGLPLKNIRPLAGKPLLVWPIEAARKSRYVDRVVISTEDEEFATIAKAAGADVPFMRPAELATDASSSFEFITHALEVLGRMGEHYEYLVLLEPTSPLTEAEDIDRALERLISQQEHADSIVGVTALVTDHPACAIRVKDDGKIGPYLSENFKQLPRRQDVEPVFSLDGSLYISTTEALLRERSFCHQRTLPYVTPRWKSLEVDDLVDFICIEAVLANRNLILGRHN
jgi:N-acylneuraminate cytidylyltransferase/CMP-N,N'-diacetyllegionaminic acid synthase